MFKDLRSDEEKAKAEYRTKARAEEREAAEVKRKGLAERLWGAPQWQEIATCPFKAYEYEVIYVTDGKAIALAKVKQRFGRPIRVIEQPEMVMTDSGFGWQGGKYEEIEAPDWWFEWELEDVNGIQNYAGGEPTGKDEVDFIATHWLPTPFSL